MAIDVATLRFATRNLLRQKARTAMTLASIVFGVVGLILSGGFVEDIFIQLRDATIHSRLGHLQVYKQGYRDNWTKDPTSYLLEDPGAIQDVIADYPEVLDSMRRITFFGVVNNGRTDLPIIGEGIEQAKESAHFSKYFSVIRGRQLDPDGAYEILLGEGVAASLNVAVGDFLNVLTNTPDVGLNSLEFEVVGVFRTFSKDFDARAVRISLTDAQELLAVDG
ncbi:MAG: ABC transporter permease, partial [Gammaproteobacteria bacterium]